MSSTIAVQPKQTRSHWTTLLVMFAVAVVAMVALTIAALSGNRGSNTDAPSRPVATSEPSQALECVTINHSRQVC